MCLLLKDSFEQTLLESLKLCAIYQGKPATVVYSRCSSGDMS